MAVPKKKTTKSKRNLRRLHDKVAKHSLNECSNCGEFKLPHHVCSSCGYYDGKEVTEIKSV